VGKSLYRESIVGFKEFGTPDPKQKRGQAGEVKFSGEHREKFLGLKVRFF